MIVVDEVTKNYRMGDATVHALQGVSLTIAAGEMTAIIGSSGSGKSTLMHILGCLDHPSSGAYSLNGTDVSTMRPNKQAKVRGSQIGFVFQTFNLLPRLSALENVELPMLYAGKRHAKPQALAMLETVGLAERAHHRPNELSGGQRQRVAIARALVNNPAVILADEPTGNLDSKTGQDILELFIKLHAENRTIVIVTHDEAIANFCPRRLRLRDGLVIADEKN